MFKTIKNRKFYSSDFDFFNIDLVKNELNALLEDDFKSFEDYKNWIYKSDELLAIIEEGYCVCYAQSTCDTEDENAKANIQYFDNQVMPLLMSIGNLISKKFVDTPFIDDLEQKDFEVIIRNNKKNIELFREKNIPIETEIMNLNQEYNKIVGSIMIDFQGKEHTVQQFQKFFYANERDLREEAYHVQQKRFAKEDDKINNIFKKMFELRFKKAKNAGYDNFRDYRFKELGIYDYTPKDCEDFRNSIIDFVVPVRKEMNEERKQKLGVDNLRSWDMLVDVDLKKPLKPYNEISELTTGVEKIFRDIKPLFGDNFKFLNDNGFFDLDSRKGKAPGGYMMPLKETGAAFIFVNGAQQHSDVNVLLHEGGHAMHFLQSKNIKLKEAQMGPAEIAEVASMSMELLGMEGLHHFYSGDDLVRAKKEHLERALMLFIPIAKNDEFQHYIYTNPNLSIDDICDYYLELESKYDVGINRMGFEKYTRTMWHHVGHFFFAPFYMLDYAIAGLGAMQVYHNYLKDRKSGIEKYFNGLHYGGSRPLPELFEKFGIKFDFSRNTVKPLIDSIYNEYKGLNNE